MKNLLMTASASLNNSLLDLRPEVDEQDGPNLPICEAQQIDRLEPSANEPTTPVYVFGRVAARFPSLSLEKEFYQALESTPSRPNENEFNISDSVDLDVLNQELSRTEILYSVLSKPANIYIAREMSWRFQTLEGITEFRILPSGDEEVTQLVTAIAPAQQGKPDPMILVGETGGDRSRHRTGKLQSVRIAALKKQPSWAVNVSIKGVTPDGSSILFADLQPLLENEGTSSGDRALNYVLLGDAGFYSGVKNLQQPPIGAPGSSGYIISSVRTLQQSIGSSSIVDVIFNFAPNTVGPEIQGYVSVNVSSVFPFTEIGFSRYIARKR
jgi:hypothetical protein